MALKPIDTPFNSIINVLREYGPVDKGFLAKITGIDIKKIDSTLEVLESLGRIIITDGRVYLSEPDTK